MKKPGVTLALAAALAVGALSAGEAEAKGRRDGVHAGRHAAAHHHRAGPRRHAMGHHHRAGPRRHAMGHHHRVGPRRHAMGHHHRVGPRKHGKMRHGAKHRKRVHRHLHAPKRFSRLKRHYHGRGHWRAKQRRHPRKFRRPPRHVRHIHVVPFYAPSYSRALEIETRDFRFSVNASG